MGMDATSKQVDELINTFDTDGDGVIALDEFFEIYAQTPIGHFDFSHVDSDRMRRIEQVVLNYYYYYYYYYYYQYMYQFY